jgi:hypothetical protein
MLILAEEKFECLKKCLQNQARFMRGHHQSEHLILVTSYFFLYYTMNDFIFTKDVRNFRNFLRVAAFFTNHAYFECSL